MYLGKVRIVRYCIGRRSVRKGTPGAKRRVEQSRKWYAFWWQGKRKMKMPLSANRREAEQRMRELERNLWRLKVGLADAFAEHRQRPIREHAADFLADLQSKSRREKHVKTMKRMLEGVGLECSITTLDDLTTAKIDGFLMNLARQGKSARTRNSYRQAIVGFAEWCAVKGRLPANPLKNVSKAEGCQVRQRRALTVDDRPGRPFPPDTVAVAKQQLDDLERWVRRRIREGWQPGEQPSTPVGTTSTTQPPKRRKRAEMPDEYEGNIRIKQFLDTHPGATVREVAEAVGLSTGKVAQMDAWRREMARRKAQKEPTKRDTRPVTKKMLEAIGQDDDVAARLDAEEAIWRRMIEEADDQKRAELHGLNKEQRKALIEAAAEHYADRLADEGQ